MIEEAWAANEKSARLKNLLAVNAFFVTLIIVLAIGGTIYWFLGKPLLNRVDKFCDETDQVREAQRLHERLEREEEARMRVKAEQEIDEQFPRMREGSE